MMDVRDVERPGCRAGALNMGLQRPLSQTRNSSLIEMNLDATPGGTD
jgi:hypothetical protein